MRDLDKAWAAVNALGGYVDTPIGQFERGYGEALDAALGEIEKLGGMDPLLRKHMDAGEALRAAVEGRLVAHGHKLAVFGAAWLCGVLGFAGLTRAASDGPLISENTGVWLLFGASVGVLAYVIVSGFIEQRAIRQDNED